MLDLTVGDVAEAVGLERAELTGDDYGRCQAVAAAAEADGYGGILAPSAALPGRRTLVVFRSGMGHVVPVWSAIRQAPPRLASLRSVIPPLRHEPTPGGAAPRDREPSAPMR